AAGFFFSSRRRHTRLQGDWSSDVCSSDLAHEVAIRSIECARLHGFFEPLSSQFSPLRRARMLGANSPCPLLPSAKPDATSSLFRSEERRVGKEWRARWRSRRWNKTVPCRQ